MTIPFKILNYIARKLSDELPEGLHTLDQHLDYIVPKLEHRGEDLREVEFWLGKRWKEVRDEGDFHESILHIFEAGGKYMLSVDGNIMDGSWQLLGGDNSIILSVAGKKELFDLKYLDGTHWVLAKNGDQARKGNRKFFFLVEENKSMYDGREITWYNLVDRLHNIYREDAGQLIYYILVVIVLALTLYALS